jgi:hypothetical protein
MIEKTLKKESMIKLNGNIYLKSIEVEKEISSVCTKFRTSQRAVLPKPVKYLDREFVVSIQDEGLKLSLHCGYLYGYGEEHCSVKKVILCIQDRMRKEEHCSEELRFMQYDLSDSQRDKYRNLYLNFLINVFLDECVKSFEKLS